METLAFRFLDKDWHLGREPLLMGILNVTPDSFSDGGAFLEPERAIEHGLRMVKEGAHLLDVGGESTRPGAPPVLADEEIRRVVPVIRELIRRAGVPISIDTVKAPVAAAAIEAGAAIVNDVSGLHRDAGMIEVLRRSGAGCVLMHMRGTPETMRQLTDYTDLIGDILDYFRAALSHAGNAGIEPERFMLDPGIGFAKTAEQNLELINNLDRFRALGRPVLVGPSRKSFIGKLLPGTEPAQRGWGTAGAMAGCILRGADVLRVHDIDEMRQVAVVAAAIRDAPRRV